MIDNFQDERELMRSAEAKIRDALRQLSPGLAASEIVEAYLLTQSTAEKVAFVAVLANRYAVSRFLSTASPSAPSEALAV